MEGASVFLYLTIRCIKCKTFLTGKPVQFLFCKASVEISLPLVWEQYCISCLDLSVCHVHSSLTPLTVQYFYSLLHVSNKLLSQSKRNPSACTKYWSVAVIYQHISMKKHLWPGDVRKKNILHNKH